MLTDKQKIAIILLRNTEKVKTTALACRVHRCTIWRWFCKRDVLRRYNLYCELDFKRTYRSENLMQLWHKYEADRDTLLKAVMSGNIDSINLMYSYLIEEYYKPLEARIEARIAPRQRNRSQ